MNAGLRGVNTYSSLRLLNSQFAADADVNMCSCYKSVVSNKILPKCFGTCTLLWIFFLFMKWQCVCTPALSRISVKYPPLEFLRHEITQLNRIWVSVNIVLKREPHIYLENSRMLSCFQSPNLFLATSFSVCRIAACLVVTSWTHPPLPITFSAAFTLTCLQNYRLGLPNWSSKCRKISSRKHVGLFLTSPFRFLSFLGYFILSLLDLLVLSFLTSPVTSPISPPLCLHSVRFNNPYRMWSLTFCCRRIKVRFYILFKSP
jgi:hypothetical protein